MRLLLALIFGIYPVAYGSTLLVAGAKAKGQPHLRAKLRGSWAAV